MRNVYTPYCIYSDLYIQIALLKPSPSRCGRSCLCPYLCPYPAPLTPRPQRGVVSQSGSSREPPSEEAVQTPWRGAPRSAQALHATTHWTWKARSTGKRGNHPTQNAGAAGAGPFQIARDASTPPTVEPQTKITRGPFKSPRPRRPRRPSNPKQNLQVRQRRGPSNPKTRISRRTPKQNPP
jgi:hypothetical protein